MTGCPSFTELAELGTDLTVVAAFLLLVVGGGIVSLVIEQAWLGLCRLWNLRKDRPDGR